jgi:hypothetical protein
VARAPDITADLSCAVGRRRDAYSVVIHLDRDPLSAQAKSSFMVKRPLASLADKLNVRANAAREMPPGVRRARAMNKATILRNAVDMREHFLGKGDALAR